VFTKAVLTMDISQSAERGKSRLEIVFETFLFLGLWASVAINHIVPMLIAGVLFCVAAICWRTDEQRIKYRTAWIGLALGVLVIGIGLSVYFRSW
jgi:hypothetical protein